MKFILSTLLRIRRVFFIPLLNSWRAWKLHMAAWLYRGHVVIGSHVSFRHPVVFQGRGRLVISDKVSLGFDLAGGINTPILLQPREPDAEIILEAGCAVMNGCEIIACSCIRIGQNTLIGPHTWIVDADFHGIAPELRRTPGKTSPVVIEENVWIGAKVVIIKGVKIGENAIVAAGCVVTKDVPAGAIVAGNPMKVVGTLSG